MLTTTNEDSLMKALQATLLMIFTTKSFPTKLMRPAQAPQRGDLLGRMPRLKDREYLYQILMLYK